MHKHSVYHIHQPAPSSKPQEVVHLSATIGDKSLQPFPGERDDDGNDNDGNNIFGDEVNSIFGYWDLGYNDWDDIRF